VAQVLSTVPLNVSFRRDLVGENLVDWHKLVQEVVTVNLNDDKYTFIWDPDRNGTFSVPSMYLAMIQDEVVPN
jgi:hypothetical protein